MKKALLLIGFMLVCMFSASAMKVIVNDYDPTPADAGDYLNVWFRVENTNDDPNNGYNLEVIPKDGLILTSGEDSVRPVRNLEAGEHYTELYRMQVLDEAAEGPNLIEARLIKHDIVLKFDLYVEVEDKNFNEIELRVGDLESDPLRIKPDDEDVKLDITLNNLGDGVAQSVTAIMSGLPEGITFSESYSNTELVGNIEADESVMVSYYIDVEETVKPQQYKAKLNVTYKYKPDDEEDDYLFEEVSLPVILSIREVPLYNVEMVTFDPSPLRAGMEDIKMHVAVRNVGEEEGESVRIKAFTKSEQPFSFDQADDFIAPILEPGEKGEATLEFKIDDDADLQTYYLDVEFKNVVDDDVITYQDKIPIVVSLPKQDRSMLFYILGAVVILVFVGGFFVRKHLASKKKVTAKKAETHYGENYLDKLSKEKKEKK